MSSAVLAMMCPDDPQCLCRPWREAAQTAESVMAHQDQTGQAPPSPSNDEDAGTRWRSDTHWGGMVRDPNGPWMWVGRASPQQGPDHRRYHVGQKGRTGSMTDYKVLKAPEPHGYIQLLQDVPDTVVQLLRGGGWELVPIPTTPHHHRYNRTAPCDQHEHCVVYMCICGNRLWREILPVEA